MSDDILSVVTAYSDVAALAQGFMNRADGERLLLPLAETSSAGSGLRFVVYLADGTPAFAGAGLCSQVSDQGTGVPPTQRYETLLDTLQFDHRSRPVYDYIVAVRSAAYAQPSASAGEEMSVDDIVRTVPPPEYDEDATMMVDPPQRQIAHADASADEEPAYEVPAYDAEPSVDAEPANTTLTLSERPSNQPEALPLGMPSFVPPPVPTGLLSRPARASHWQPAPPRRPTPRISTGLFRYTAAGLPRPARPPRPDLDPSLQVDPAPRPA